MVSGEENYICPSSKFWEKRYYYRSSAWIIYWFKWISYMYLQPTAYSTSTSTSTTYNVPQLHRQPYQISIHNNTLIPSHSQKLSMWQDSISNTMYHVPIIATMNYEKQMHALYHSIFRGTSFIVTYYISYGLMAWFWMMISINWCT